MFGIRTDYSWDFKILVIQWALKFTFFTTVSFIFNPGTFVRLSSMVLFIEIYATLEFYMALTYLLNMRIYYLKVELRYFNFSDKSYYFLVALKALFICKFSF